MIEIEYITTVATQDPPTLRTTCQICNASYRGGFGDQHEKWMKKHSAKHLADILETTLIREENPNDGS